MFCLTRLLEEQCTEKTVFWVMTCCVTVCVYFRLIHLAGTSAMGWTEIDSGGCDDI